MKQTTANVLAPEPDPEPAVAAEEPPAEVPFRARKVSSVAASWSAERVELILLDEETFAIDPEALWPLLAQRGIW